jgi:hypothetical protein
MTQAEVFLEFLKSLLHIFFMTPTNFVGVFVFINNLILLFYLYIRLFYRNNLKQYIYEKQFKTIQNNSKQFKKY